MEQTAAPTTRAALERLDRDDALAPFRDAFALPDDTIYLDGNSLGPLPRATPGRLAEVMRTEWGRGLIRSWTDIGDAPGVEGGWMAVAGRVGDKIGRLVGAAPGTVMAADSTTINLFKLLGVALAMRPDRRVILTQDDNFPTDLYVAEGMAALLGRGHVLRRVAADRLADAVDADTAVVMLTHVNFRTGAMHDMAALTRAARAAGALSLWDLAHSAGAVPVDLAGCGADFAVGCGYKFLNGGPGAPAFLYVAPALQDAAQFPIAGWLGHAEPFGFHPGYRPAAGIARATIGTPSILAMAALEVGVDIALRAPMEAVRAKSLLQSGLLMALVARFCPELACASPADPARRGSQASFRHPDAGALMAALIARGVVGDFRTPDILRFGITPLTLRHVELWDAVMILREVLDAAGHAAPGPRPGHKAA